MKDLLSNPGVWFLAFAVVVIVCCAIAAMKQRHDIGHRGKW